MPDMSSSMNVNSLFSLFVGTPGTRKSTTALSYPRPQFWLSWDQKMQALIKPMRNWGINPKDVTYEDYDDWDTGRAKLESFQLSCPFKTIIIDSATSMANASLRQVKLSKGTSGKKVGGIAINSIEDYNAESAALLEMMAICKGIKKTQRVHIILIAHLIQAEYKSSPNAEANIVRTIVTAGKRVAPMIPALVDESYHFFLEEQISGEAKYTVLTSSTTEDFGRTILPLERKITFGDEPLYDKWILPAISRINSASPATTSQLVTGEQLK